ncbi:MAG: G-D-S-L family lipolytic protein [Cellulophaga sp.]
MKIKYIALLAVLVGLTACNDEEDFSKTEVVVALPELSSGSADFSNYVALGASFTAGYTDGALFKASQGNSFPQQLANKFAGIGGGSFTQPLMNDNTGGMVAGTTPVVAYRLIFNGTGPQRLNEFLAGLGAPTPPITTDITANLGSTFNNVGVPGAKSFHLLANGYGNVAGVSLGLANPYFVRMASSPNASMLEDALSQEPTFFTLSEIGGNDVLSYATSGGIGIDQTGHFNPQIYGKNDITDPTVFGQVFEGIVTQLTSGSAKGVIANVPYITSLPYFTTIPNNALVLDAAQAAGLTGFFQAYAGIFTQGLIGLGVPPANAQALAAQYAITFTEGSNRFLIDVPASATNPQGFRQMTENELLLLPIDRGAIAAQGYGSVAISQAVLQVLGILQAGGTPTAQQAGLVLAAVNAIDDKDALDTEELLSIQTATDAYNVKIKAVADATGLAFVDFKSILEKASTTGLVSGDYTLTTNLVTGSLVSLDGVHLTARGYALMANEFMKAIDVAYGSNFEASGSLLDVGNSPTNYSHTLQ